MIVENLSTARQTAEGPDVCLGTFENDRFFVGSHQNGDRPGLILNPLQDLSLCVGIRTINLVKNHTGLARNGVLDQGQKRHRRHTGIAQFLDVLVGAKHAGCIHFKGFIVHRLRCCQSKRGLSDSGCSVQQHGKTMGWLSKIVGQRAFYFLVTEDFVKCLWAIRFRVHIV
jgi:hypothetical protein